MNKQQFNEFEELFKNKKYLDNHIDCNHVYIEDFETIEEVEEYFQERIQEHEVIYYSNAIEFLQHEDPSLRDSLDIAEELCFEVSSINSELLATLLLQNIMSGELAEVFNNCFQNLKD